MALQVYFDARERLTELVELAAHARVDPQRAAGTPQSAVYSADLERFQTIAESILQQGQTALPVL